MKIIGTIGIVVVIVAIFGGFWLYRATMPEDVVVEELAPDANDVSKNSQFLQLQPKSLPPAGKEIIKEPAEEQPTETIEEPGSVQKSSDAKEEPLSLEEPRGQVSGAEDGAIVEDSGGTSITDIDEPGVVISMTDVGFFPASISVEVGSTVTFINDGQSSHWPASNEHSTHNMLPGFDSDKAISTGGAYAYTFTKLGEWSFHDHLNPDFIGTIVVE